MGIFGSLLEALPTLLRTVPAVQQGMNGVNLKQQQQLGSDISQLAQAQTNTSNPLFQSLYGQNMQAGNQNLANTIGQLQSQNRLALANGQAPLLNQERGSESIFRNLVQGQQDVGNTALQNTFGQLRNAQQSLGGAYNTQNQLANSQFANTQKQTAAYGSIGDALQGLFGLGNKQGQQSQTQAPTQINWNQPQSYQTPQNNSYGPQPMSLLPQNSGYVANGGY